MSDVYLNGEYLPVEQACVSVLDRGFTFADAVYEVIPVYGKRIFRLQEHLSRLNDSLSEVFINNPCSDSQWQEIFTEVLERNNTGPDRFLYVQVTRGVSERDHLYEDNLTPTVFVMCKPIKTKNANKGVSAITHEDIRWKYCHIKATALLASVLLKQRAHRADGASEAILIRNGQVTEGASSNVFIVKDGTVITAEKDGSVLPGITRDLIVELLQHEAIPCLESSITLPELRVADEVWLTSSTMGIVPVIRIDGVPVADGNPGKLWIKADWLYQDFKTNSANMQ